VPQRMPSPLMCEQIRTMGFDSDFGCASGCAFTSWLTSTFDSIAASSPINISFFAAARWGLPQGWVNIIIGLRRFVVLIPQNQSIRGEYPRINHLRSTLCGRFVWCGRRRLAFSKQLSALSFQSGRFGRSDYVNASDREKQGQGKSAVGAEIRRARVPEMG